ncbi:ABC transporter ATP-binding protein [Pseudorhodoplanes sp.]|uniref:ABC transporter ATP-binding protein n=1 Tax=Pseudorhodoplanes sp. TaxID=1934341 RepID=UPI002D1D875C|nr:ABC transporter ATP-binding protein [Pseudorhodoplanes sp.]HWV54849.1 ABC transporter ATP-binding protein [Pseudorhodoplanes sp.]
MAAPATVSSKRIEAGSTPASIAAKLSFDHVTHRYGDVTAVRDVSLDIEPGEIVCLLGRSGCGKTTLLRLAAGVEDPSEGRVLINDRAVSQGPGYLPPERRGVGLMFQDFALFPHLTNLANVMFGLKSLPRAEAEREAMRALDRVGLAAHAASYPHMLSGGEQQRVALARAVVPRPSVLLMDEPFSGLDRRLRDDVRDETLSVLREARVSCIVVTHDPEEALRMGDRIALMNQGSLIQSGTPEEIYTRPKDLFVARFFCDLNEIAGTVRGGLAETPVGRFAAPGMADGTPVIVAIRPQALRFRSGGEGAEARIRHRQFLGHVDLVEVAVEGVDSPLKGRILRDAIPQINDSLRLECDPAEVLVFAAPGA